MNLRMGSQFFRNVQIPILWGERAILQDRQGHLSIIDLSGETAHVEVLCDEPAPQVAFRPRVDGIVILRGDEELYVYNVAEKSIRSISLGLPEIQISPRGTRVGASLLSGNSFSGAGVGLAVSKDGVSLGGPLPPGLAKLAV